jgi:Glutathione-dependent formaldehyde-activating enzyme
MKLPLRGGCVCGAIRYEISREPLRVYACHCKDCQRFTGSAFAIGVVVPSEAFQLTGREMRLVPNGITEGGRLKRLSACPECGTAVRRSEIGLALQRYGPGCPRRNTGRYVMAETDHTRLDDKRAAVGHSAGRFNGL